MKDRHLQILNTVNEVLGYILGAVVLLAVILFVLALRSDSSADTLTEPYDAAVRTETSAAVSSPDPTRLWIEETFSSEDLYLWDEFHRLTDSGLSDQKAIDTLVESTGYSEQLLKEHLQNLQHWIATENYPYTAQGFKMYVLEPAISFHPGTAGSSLQRAQAAATILFNIADKHFQFAGSLNVADAVNMMTEEELSWLRENLPGLIGEMDSLIEQYPEIDGVYQDAGADSFVYRAMQREAVAEDWTVVRAALMEIEQESE